MNPRVNPFTAWSGFSVGQRACARLPLADVQPATQRNNPQNTPITSPVNAHETRNPTVSSRFHFVNSQEERGSSFK